MFKQKGRQNRNRIHSANHKPWEFVWKTDNVCGVKMDLRAWKCETQPRAVRWRGQKVDLSVHSVPNILSSPSARSLSLHQMSRSITSPHWVLDSVHHSTSSRKIATEHISYDAASQCTHDAQKQVMKAALTILRSHKRRHLQYKEPKQWTSPFSKWFWR